MQMKCGVKFSAHIAEVTSLIEARQFPFTEMRTGPSQNERVSHDFSS